jgi:hypothetical protein
MKKICRILLFILLFPAVPYAFDYTRLQPISPYGVFSTFSTESLTRNSVAAELNAERTGRPEFFRFGLKGVYGLTDSIELSFLAPYINRYADSVEGAEDFSVGYKHRFYDEGKYGPSLAYVLNVSINNGKEEFSTKGRFGAGLIASKRVGPFKGHINFFIERPGSGTLKNEVFFSGGVDFSAANNFNLLGELIVKKGHNSNQYDQVETYFGYRIKTTDYWYTTIGVGLNVKDKNPEYRFLLSVCVTSPHEKKEIMRIYEEE